MTNLETVREKAPLAQESLANNDFVTLTIGDQLFGIPVLKVQDVLGAQKVAHTPLANEVVAGSLNLRGRIVTAIDVRRRLGMPSRDKGDGGMSVVVEHEGELYSLIIDSIGEVLRVPASNYEPAPSTLDPSWRDFSAGIYRLDGQLMVVLDVERILDIENVIRAA